MNKQVRFKLDENFGKTVLPFFRAENLNAKGVLDEGLRGAADEEVLKAACQEDRILLTMDHDFGNVLRYPPSDTPGIVIINNPGRASPAVITFLMQNFLKALEMQDVRGKLWIVEPGRIREHE